VKKGKSGFTLLELLVVVGILAALVALALPFYQDYVNQSKLTAAEADLQTFKKALAMYDQLETAMFNETNFLPLIGKYLQDFRTFPGQTQPLDPWANDYDFLADAGVIWSYGPNGNDDSAVSALTRNPSGDDIMVTWKPDFFLASARRINDTTLEIGFSRKVSTTTPLAIGHVTAPAGISVVQKISDTIFRLKFNAVLATTGTVTLSTGLSAQDGRQLVNSLRPTDPAAGPSSAHTISYQ
jgi:prepilin-type N-terminal cleavage/methylation domain-containing protein